MCGVVSRKKYKFVYPRERLRACAIYSIERESFPYSGRNATKTIP